MQAVHAMGETGNNSEGMDHMANLTTMITELQHIFQEQQEEICALRQQNQDLKSRVEGDGAPSLPPPTITVDCVSRAQRTKNRVN